MALLTKIDARKPAPVRLAQEGIAHERLAQEGIAHERFARR